MKIQELVHKRILVATKRSGYSQSSEIEEIKILEISPSQNFIKIMNMNGNKYWKHSRDIVPIEILAFLEKSPKNN